MDRVFVVDKPSGLTSHDVVARVRRALRTRRVGHAGTLDPSATGVLIVLVGRATRLAQFFVECGKRYHGRLVLGSATDSHDARGAITAVSPYEHVTEREIERVFREFEGEIDQVPPMVSALKHDGTPLYVLARRGETVEREPRKVRIASLRLMSVALPVVEFDVSCSRGTYVRMLAHDIGHKLGTHAHLKTLTRTEVGPFSLDEAVTLQEIDVSGPEAQNLGLSMFDALAFLPQLHLTGGELDTISTGGAIEIS
ncbi:MAG: tRNA pseudouridine(55) synthase TruB, partial [Candidatus Eisenbacteria bacterium]|nr:tRNA pseudouridine(55) synthase TruB [Candidatus Eisenbacteria bacterium]